MLNADELIRRLTGSGICQPQDIVGCSAKDISEIETHIGNRLPDAYRSFLRVAGRSAGAFLQDWTVFFPQVQTLTERSRVNLKGIVVFPMNTFVFADRFGECLLFFILGTSDDPPVFCWSEARDQPEVVFQSVWCFLEDEIAEAERLQ
jgi:hypothetical protein